MGVKQAIRFAKETGFDGLEIVPTRIIIDESLSTSDLRFVKGAHHNWRLDIGQDNKYGINILTGLVFIALRLILFPSISKSRTFLQYISDTTYCPVTVHDILRKWTKDNNQKEFKGGVQYEILNTSNSPRDLKQWLNDNNHFIAVDTRDDQSLLWAKRYGFKDWKEFWAWIGLKKIKSIQLTLIGLNGMKKILNHKKSLPEEQLLWLHNQKWEGNSTIEVNPISLYILNKGKFREGLKTISSFVHQALIHGKKWSY